MWLLFARAFGRSDELVCPALLGRGDGSRLLAARFGGSPDFDDALLAFAATVNQHRLVVADVAGRTFDLVATGGEAVWYLQLQALTAMDAVATQVVPGFALAHTDVIALGA